MKSGIYIITNTVNNKHYVGESVNLSKRLLQHKSNLKYGRHSNPFLQKAVNKYGLDKFTFELLEECEEIFLKSQESYWCNMLNTHNDKYGYNIDSCDPNGICRRKSESTKKLISDLAKQRDQSGSNNPFYGKKHTLETIEKIKEGQRKTGWKMPDHHKEIMREKARKMRGGLHPDSKKVIDINTGIIYGSIKEAAQGYGVNYNTLKDYLSGAVKNKTTLKLYEQMGTIADNN